MLYRILRLKARLLLKKVKEFTFISAAILIALIGLALYTILKKTSSSPFNYYVLGVFSFVIMAVHQGRKDYHFCKIMLIHPFVLFFTEYLLIAIPFIIISMINKQLILGGLYFVFPMIIAITPQLNHHSAPNKKPFVFSLPSLETISFFRKYQIVIWTAYFSALCLCYVSAISIVIVYFLIIFFSCASFSRTESLTLLCINEYPAKKFINQKIKLELLFWGKLFLPIFFLYAIFNIETAFMILIPILLGSLFIIFCISAKYKQYKPNTSIEGSIYQAIGLVGFFFPLFLPISIILTLVYYIQAIDNLKSYLDVYNK